MVYDVINMGSATVDIYNVMSCKIKECIPGDKILVEKLDYEIGGGGVNSGIAFSRMGLKTAFLGKIGHDHNGVRIIHELRKEKVDFLHMKPSKLRTSQSVILTSTKDKDRIIYAYKGASDDISYREIDLSKVKTKWVYMATLLGKSFSTAEKISAYCKNKGIKLMFNPSSYLARKGKKLSKILKNTDILVLNKKEAQLILKSKSTDVKRLVLLLFRMGPKAVVVTDGPRGIVAYDGRWYHNKAYKVKVVSTAGAGDAFASGFLAGLIHKQDVEHALKVGMANAASVIQYYGTKNKLLSERQAHNFIRNRK